MHPMRQAIKTHPETAATSRTSELRVKNTKLSQDQFGAKNSLHLETELAWKGQN